MFDMTLAELVQGKPTAAVSDEDYALAIRDKIADASALQEENDVLRDRVAELEGEAEDRKQDYNTIDVLRDLVGAIDKLKLAKVCRVGALVVVNDADDMASRLGEALTAARALL
jgi:hypothetical protein